MLRFPLDFISGKWSRPVSSSETSTFVKSDKLTKHDNVNVEEEIGIKVLKKELPPKHRRSKHEVRNKFRCCARCGKPVKKEKHKSFKSSPAAPSIYLKRSGFSNESEMLTDSNISATTSKVKIEKMHANENRNKSFDIPNTVVEATEQTRMVDVDGQDVLQTREISFILEDRTWINMPMHDHSKAMLQKILDHKIGVADKLHLFHNKLVRVERLLDRFMQLLEDESFSMTESSEDSSCDESK